MRYQFKALQFSLAFHTLIILLIIGLSSSSVIGSAKDIKVMRSSGVDVLDKSAIEAVENASPFPKPPIEAQIIIPIVYRLD
jgi:hypothetical protein